MASRYGTSRMLGCLPKFLRIRFFSVKEYAIGSPQNGNRCTGPALSDEPRRQMRNALADLLDLDLRARVLELLLEAVGIGLVHAFLHSGRHAFDQILRFLQAQARDFANNLDHRYLLAGRVLLQEDGEFRLLLSGSSGSRTTRARRGSDGDRGS